jgi:excisionase family DNA binding protein
MTAPPDPTALRHARRRAGLSQRHLASQLGGSQVAVQYWETGRRHPGPRALRQLTALLPLPAPENARPEHRWLTATDAARRTGVSRRAIYRAMRTGRLPSRYPGRPVLIGEADLMAWQARRRRLRG